MGTTKLTHFQFDIRITHYDVIALKSCDIVWLSYWKSPDRKFYCTTNHMLPSNNSWKEIGNVQMNCVNEVSLFVIITREVRCSVLKLLASEVKHG